MGLEKIDKENELLSVWVDWRKGLGAGFCDRMRVIS